MANELARWLPLVASVLAGCDVPQDPERSFDQAVARGWLRVGLDDAGEDDHERERAVVEAFAASAGLSVRWQRGSGSALLEDLSRYRLDLVVAGLKADDPWLSGVSASQPWHRDRQGARVIAVAPGENRLLTRLDEFILRRREGS